MQLVTDKAYLLHKRPYRDQRLSLELFTSQHGIIQALISVSNRKNDTRKAYLQLSHALSLEYVYRENSFSQIKQLDLMKQHKIDIKNIIYCQYLNELLLTLFPKHHAHDDIFITYEKSLFLLAEDFPISATRMFEVALIKEFSSLPELPDVNHIEPEKTYFFSPQLGFYDCAITTEHRFTAIKGNAIIAFLNILEDPVDEESAYATRKISRLWIDSLLNGKPLKTREIFQNIHQQTKFS